MPDDSRFLEEVEISLLLEGLFRLYGLDFRNYSYALLRKRIRSLCLRKELNSVSALQERVFRDSKYLHELVETLTLSSACMFREPEFYRVLQEQVLPLFKNDQLLRIWHPGCATGQEAYSLAILLTEEGLYERCRIYATDLNKTALKRAKAGILPMSAMKQYTKNYVQAGGKRAFSEYYTANYDCVKVSPSLLQNIIFAQHDLVSDGFFNECQLVLLRNVLINFNPQMREQVLGLVHESVSPSGILGLGKWDTLKSTRIEHCYKELDSAQKLYRRYCA